MYAGRVCEVIEDKDLNLLSWDTDFSGKPLQQGRTATKLNIYCQWQRGCRY